MQLSYGAATDPGRKRSENEDSLRIDLDPDRYPERPALFVVCDGVGGAAAGKTASTIAVSGMIAAFRESTTEPMAERLIEATERASAAILDHSRSNPATWGMATTLVAAAFDREACHVVNVGDSRAYRLSEDRLQRVTVDHTLVQEQLLSGAITAEQAASSPYRHVITRSLGRERSGVGAQTYPPIPLQAGDRYILCSDGLTDMVSDAEICKIAAEQEPERAAVALVNLANSHGGGDNITVIVIQVKDG
jgi:serine/threonine protein phosphatase PrpC